MNDYWRMDMDDDACRGATHGTSQRAGILLVALSAVGWSMAGLFIRLVAVDIWVIVGWRGLFGAVFVILYLGLREGARFTGLFARFDGPAWLVATLITLSSVCYLGALQAGSIATVVVIYATSPFVTAGIAGLVLRETPLRGTLIASAVALVGVAIVVDRPEGDATTVSLLLACLATATMSLVTIVSRRFSGVSMIPATGLSAIQLGIVGGIAAPLGSPSSHDLVILAALAFTLSGSLAFYVEGARRIVTAQATLLSTLDVPLAPFWVWVFLNDVPRATTIAGGCLVMAAVLCDATRGWWGRPSST